MKRVSRWINRIQFKLGRMVFPVMEPCFRTAENRHREVKKHFFQALSSLEQNNLSVALLNLNMVLSLNPVHFMARVYRARIYFQEKRYKLASEDYLEACQISRYRFIQHGLLREFKNTHQALQGVDLPTEENLDEVFELLQESRKNRIRGIDKLEVREHPEAEASEFEIDFDEIAAVTDSVENNRKALDQFGPITEKEVAETDWDRLIKELTS